MAQRAKRFCAAPGCSSLTDGSRYCETHAPEVEAKRAAKKRAYQRSRPTTTEQGYGSKWRRKSLAYRRIHPLCEECEADGKVVLAVMVHHKQAVKDGGVILDDDNLQSLCNDCHEKIEGPRRWARKVPRGGANP